jgi:hypothetical protein
MGIHPDTVFKPLAFVIRGQTRWIPAHLDPDESSIPVLHLYVWGLDEGTAGNRLVVASRRQGGQVVTPHTRSHRGEM